ncbi:hypothetical protein SAMN04487969_105201 [Paenibacillus algorifonticola]|uniref:Uncharacterized protein n=1 Tax=Paenibacillus algorifonticola TaxID=684063 RepID=A0A1I2CPI4_9BACL|nr:hypothetical protein [Paenibacillus algorifonticola]SFE70289.1 hypothetical protein SAMN04487969_105201 [Paenibacillus algorifonticola]
MEKGLSNKHKIRGWKRRVREIEKWKQRYMQLDMEYLAHHQRDYVKLWIDPFYRLVRRNPPVWFSRLLLAALLDIYEAWHQQLKQRNEAFYLKIWLFEPDFISSQVVAAIGEQLHAYDHAFEQNTMMQVKADERLAKLPLLQKIKGVELFAWQLHIDAEFYYESELEDDLASGFRTEREVKCIKSKAYDVEKQQWSGQPDSVYKLQAGDVWVGERRERTSDESKG